MRIRLFVLTLISVGFNVCIAQIDKDNMDLSVRPQDDFYNYVNGKWMEKTKIPDDRSRWGSFDELRERTDIFTLTLMDELVKSDYQMGSDEQKIKDYFESIINWENRNKMGLSELKPYFEAIDNIKNLNDVYRYMSDMSAEGRDPFVGLWVYNHMKRSNENALYVGDISLGLGRDYYQKTDDRTMKVLAKYEDFINRLYEIAYPNSTDNFGKIYINFEKMAARYLLSIEDVRNSELQYNPIAVKDFNSNVSSFPLKNYLNAQGYSGIDTVIIGEIKYYKNLDKLLNERNVGFLKKFMKVQLLNESMSVLSKEMDSINFEFYGKELSGQKKQRSIEKRALQTINWTLGELLGKIYVKKAFPEEAKQTAEELVSYLKKSYEKHINNLAWMSPKTKEKALYKLNKITVKIGYPDKWKDFSGLKITSVKDGGTCFSNAREFRRWKQGEHRKKINKPVDKTEWGMSPQTVNAYYNPMNNEIVFPAAILQPPFFSYKASPAINFGGIGAVIGHEISHGFDDGGSQFDGDGNLRNWWTDEDKAKFKEVTNKLVAQYDSYEPLPEVHVNGKFTLGENIADLAGVAVAYDALKMYEADKSNGLANFDGTDFFLSWATIWRTKARDKAIANLVKTDPHSPGFFRAIGPLVNLDGFYETFDLKSTDKHYKKPEDRIVIW